MINNKVLHISEGNRRDQILQIATSLFYQKGYERTSIKDIALGVGIKSSVLYYYFRNKEDILAEIISSSLKQAISESEEAISCYSNPMQQLEMYVRLTVDRKVRGSQRISLHLTELRSLSPARRAEVIALRDRYQGILGDIITRGMLQGQFAEGDAKLATYAIFGIINRIPLWFSPRGRLKGKQVSDYYYKFILAALNGMHLMEL